MRMILVLALMLMPAAATAQNLVWKQATPGLRCTGNLVSGPDLGFSNTECVRCTISGKHVAGQPDIEFATEPAITGIRKGGPADGKLEEHDVLVSVDGQLITTRAGAIHYSDLEAGKPVRLTVRRNGALKDVEITPASKCFSFAPFARTQLKTVPLIQPKTRLALPSKVAGRGWFGLGLSCGLCGASLGLQTIPFRAFPEVAEVTPDSPAAKAGLKIGDVLLAIDDVSLKSPEGSAVFRDVKPNQKVKILLIRNIEVLTITLTAAAPR